uniref:Uncharacterized protein n=1 Tax=Pseudochlorodesmis sp. HV01306c TaxID=2358490 RepID=A0A386AYJ0_9CHLO|nr:hypothetical protein Ycf47 [Pseudochlorodesmis sp. HV01306c]
MFLSHFLLSFLIVIIIEPQQPQWNPLITQLRKKNVYSTYKTAKKNLNRITWSIIFIFCFMKF